MPVPETVGGAGGRRPSTRIAAAPGNARGGGGAEALPVRGVGAGRGPPPRGPAVCAARGPRAGPAGAACGTAAAISARMLGSNHRPRSRARVDSWGTPPGGGMVPQGAPGYPPGEPEGSCLIHERRKKGGRLAQRVRCIRTRVLARLERGGAPWCRGLHTGPRCSQ